MAGKRGRAYEDLRTDGGNEKTKGIRPGLLNSLFSGGVAKGGNGDSDLRSGRAKARPGESRMLFAGGKARTLASEDARMGAKGEGSDRPANLEMLDEGGEVDDQGGGDGGSVSDAEIVAAEDIMDCLSGGFGYGSSPSENDSKMEKASKEAARKARAQVFAQALKAFLSIAGG